MDFGVLYSEVGRPSVALEKLLGALLLQAFYSIRLERQLMDPLDDSLPSIHPMRAFRPRDYALRFNLVAS